MPRFQIACLIFMCVVASGLTLKCYTHDYAKEGEESLGNGPECGDGTCLKTVKEEDGKTMVKRSCIKLDSLPTDEKPEIDKCKEYTDSNKNEIKNCACNKDKDNKPCNGANKNVALGLVTLVASLMFSRLTH